MLLDEANINSNNAELLDKGKFLEFAMDVCEKKKNLVPA